MSNQKILNSLFLIYDVGKLERGKLAGITFTKADKIVLALDSELEFREFEMCLQNFCE